jgi:hypothetical protein
MKKLTIQEEKDRFRQIVEQGATMTYGFKPNNEEAKTSVEEEIPIKKVEQGISPNTNKMPGMPDMNDLDDAIGEFVLNCLEAGLSHEAIKTEVLKSLDDALEANDDNEGGRLWPEGGNESLGANPHETDEYHQQYNANMTQGFSNINEGNAFVGAAKKAKEEGKDSFELGGKKYKVTVTASKK